MHIRHLFGIAQNPFEFDSTSKRKFTLLEHQQLIFDTLTVHCQQGGFCLLLGQPGTGKSAIKSALALYDEQRLFLAPIGRTLHTYSGILRILCQAFKIDSKGRDFTCEKQLINQALKFNQEGKMIVPLIDDAHLMNPDCLRKLRLLFEEFPKNHNLILIGLPSLLSTLNLAVHEEIKSRLTYSVILQRLNPDQIKDFILGQLDACGLPHRTFSEEALDLVVRSCDGVLRRCRNLCVSSLMEAAHDRTKVVDLVHVNRVLLQPHWRKEQDLFQSAIAVQH